MSASGPSGILLLDKPTGCTSHSVVARARKHFGLRRVGHAGTLDPDASGVLVLGLGPATRLLGYLSGADKEYAATFALGAATTTDDAAGEIITRSDAGHLEKEDVEAAVESFVGVIRQRPSAVSAIKVDGKRAYDRVRAGEEVVLDERSVTVDSFSVEDVRRRPSADGDGVWLEVDVRVECSSGTYIRALARDVGNALGVGGHVVELRRTRSGPFTVAECTSLDALEAARLLTPGEAASRSLPSLEVAEDRVDLIHHGVRIEWPGEEPADVNDVVALMANGELLAIASCSGGRALYRAVFA